MNSRPPARSTSWMSLGAAAVEETHAVRTVGSLTDVHQSRRRRDEHVEQLDEGLEPPDESQQPGDAQDAQHGCVEIDAGEKRHGEQKHHREVKHVPPALCRGLTRLHSQTHERKSSERGSIEKLTLKYSKGVKATSFSTHSMAKMSRKMSSEIFWNWVHPSVCPWWNDARTQTLRQMHAAMKYWKGGDSTNAYSLARHM
jgi:hypothetical protein